MLNALKLFKQNIEEARNLTSLYDYLDHSIASPFSFDDLLRAQVVYSVSAFDKLIHDVVRIGMLQIFVGQRPATRKYLAEAITLETYAQLLSATIPPREYVFEEAIIQKLKAVSYQEPSKVGDGLSYIWDEKQKWQKIALNMSVTDSEARTRLKLIADRRNVIVHEADINPITNQKYSISKEECTSITDFLENCGEEIVNLVI